MSRERQFEATIEHLARRWKGMRPLLPAFALLSRGEPLEVAAIARATGAGSDQIEEILGSARCARDDDGRIIDLFGMTLTPTQHRLDIGSATTFACCALWAHAIPRLVGLTAKVESVDPTSGEAVRLSISPNGIESVQTQGAVAVLAVAEPQAIEANVGAAFCSHVRHFASRDTALPFAAAMPSRYLVDLAQLDEAASLLHTAIVSSSAS